MPRFNNCNYKQTTVVPISLEDQKTKVTLEFAIHYLLENEINLFVFDEKFNTDKDGCPAYAPSILLKIILSGSFAMIVTSNASA